MNSPQIDTEYTLTLTREQMTTVRLSLTDDLLQAVRRKQTALGPFAERLLVKQIDDIQSVLEVLDNA